MSSNLQKEKQTGQDRCCFPKRQGTALTVGAVAHGVFQKHLGFLSRFLGHFNCHIKVFHPLAHLQAGTAREEARMRIPQPRAVPVC